jgi:hypothetical protein
VTSAVRSGQVRSGQVRSILSRAGRADDYLEIGVDTGVCYNPLHNDLDPYAVAYAIATLLNNLFGRSKEPFWQQAYTDLLVGTQSISSLRSALPGDESTQMSIQSFPHAGGHRCREG